MPVKPHKLRIVIAAGALFWADRLSAALADAGHDCVLLTGDPVRQVPGVAVRRLPLVGLLGRVAARLHPRLGAPMQGRLCEWFDRWASSVVERLRPDVVIGWSSWVRATADVAKRRGALVGLERGSTHMEHQRRVLEDEYARWQRPGVPLAAPVVERELGEYGLADWITVPSRFARDTFIAQGVDGARLEVSPFGVDIEAFRPARSRPPGFRVLFVGLVDLRKGVPYLLRAYEQIRGPDTQLTLLGHLAAGMRPLLREIGAPFEHRPTVCAAQVARLMAESSVLVLPSLEEGLARVMLEAMASGIPVIATPASGAEDVIEHGQDGLIVPERDVNSLAEALRFLRDHPVRGRGMGTAARRRAEAHFSWAAYARRSAEIIGRRSGAAHAPGSANGEPDSSTAAGGWVAGG